MSEDFLEFIKVFWIVLLIAFTMLYCLIKKKSNIIYQGDLFDEIIMYFFATSRSVKIILIENNIYYLELRCTPIPFYLHEVIVNKNKKMMYGPKRIIKPIKKILEENNSLVGYSEGFDLTYNKRAKDVFRVSNKNKNKRDVF